jgi:hypothetical protein
MTDDLTLDVDAAVAAIADARLLLALASEKMNALCIDNRGDEVWLYVERGLRRHLSEIETALGLEPQEEVLSMKEQIR